MGYILMIIIFLAFPKTCICFTLNETECYTLSVYREDSKYKYTFKQIPSNVTVTINCNPTQIVSINSANYLLPKRNFSYCIGKKHSCSSSERCSCCTKPVSDANIYVVPFSNNSMLQGQCSHNTTCQITVPRKYFTLAEYPTVYDSQRCQRGGWKWCIARWIEIHYSCQSVSTTKTTPSTSTQSTSTATTTARPYATKTTRSTTPTSTTKSTVVTPNPTSTTHRRTITILTNTFTTARQEVSNPTEAVTAAWKTAIISNSTSFPPGSPQQSSAINTTIIGTSAAMTIGVLVIITITVVVMVFLKRKKNKEFNKQLPANSFVNNVYSGEDDIISSNRTANSLHPNNKLTAVEYEMGDKSTLKDSIYRSIQENESAQHVSNYIQLKGKPEQSNKSYNIPQKFKIPNTMTDNTYYESGDIGVNQVSGTLNNEMTENMHFESQYVKDLLANEMTDTTYYESKDVNPAGNEITDNTYYEAKDVNNPAGNEMTDNTYYESQDINIPIGNEVADKTYQESQDVNIPAGNEMTDNTYYESQDVNNPAGNEMTDNTYYESQDVNIPIGNEMTDNTYYESQDVNNPAGNEMTDNTYYESQDVNNPAGNEVADNTSCESQNVNNPASNEMIDTTYYESKDVNKLAGNEMTDNTYYESNMTENGKKNIMTSVKGQVHENDDNNYVYTYGHFKLEGRERAPHK